MTWLAVAIGGGVGSMLRYAVGVALLRPGATFPLGTLAVNIIGSFLIGLFARALNVPTIDPLWRTALTVGLCGGFTTFSTFSAEVLVMAQEGRMVRAATYVLSSVVLGVLASFLGLGLGERLLTALRS